MVAELLRHPGSAAPDAELPDRPPDRLRHRLPGRRIRSLGSSVIPRILVPGYDTSQTTTLTIRPGTTITLRGSPVRCSATAASAAARTESSVASAATSTRPRTLPFTCTG